MTPDDVTVYRPAFSVRRPAGQRPICGQCRRDLAPDGAGWRHLDGTPRCAQGTADAVRALCRIRWR